MALRRNCRLESGKLFDWPWLEEYRAYVIFNDAADDDNDDFESPTSSDSESANDGSVMAEMNCLHSANFTMVQLGLLRMDEVVDANVEASGRNTDKYFLRQLFFGKAVWDAKNATYFRPSGFQDPLVDADQVSRLVRRKIERVC